MIIEEIIKQEQKDEEKEEENCNIGREVISE